MHEVEKLKQELKEKEEQQQSTNLSTARKTRSRENRHKRSASRPILKTSSLERAHSAGRKAVTFNLDNEVSPAAPEQLSYRQKCGQNVRELDTYLPVEESDDVRSVGKSDFHLDELQQIDDLCKEIDDEIRVLAKRENKEVRAVEKLLEAHAAQPVMGRLVSGGLDKIYERDDEGVSEDTL